MSKRKALHGAGRTIRADLIRRAGGDPDLELYHPCRWCLRIFPWFSEVDREALTIDHVIPKADGGSGDLDNLVLACWSCNQLRARHWDGCQDCARGDFCLLGMLLGFGITGLRVRQCVTVCPLTWWRANRIRHAVLNKGEPKILTWLTSRSLNGRTRYVKPRPLRADIRIVGR